MCDIVGSQALDGENAIGGFIARTFPARDSWYSRSCRDDLVGFEILDLGDLLGGGDIAGGIDDKQIGGVFLGNDTAEQYVSVNDTRAHDCS